MAVSSVLNPEAIVGRQQGTSAGFQNFLTGGSPIGSSVVGSAANNIVGFQRSLVKPQFPDINNIINSINNNVDNSISNITNITNRNIDSQINALRNELYGEIGKGKSSEVTQLQTVVQNIQNQVNQTLQQSLNNFSRDYQDRVKQVDDAKPTGVLGKFLGVYRTAIDFINFFGNKKNINALRDNLNALKNSFTESFEVAKLVRNVIIKIVKQLSSLPKASPSGGGGLNIDVDVPGGGLKRTAPRGLGNMFRGKGKMLALGAGALGLGAGGAAAVNALSDSDATKPGFSGLGLGEDPLSSFASIVERFSIAINELFGIGKNADKKRGSSGGTSGGKSSSGPGGPGGPGGPSPDASKTLTPGDSPPEIKALMDAIDSTEGTWDSVNYGKGPGKIAGLENMTIDEALKASDSYIKQYGGTGTLGRYQHHPTYLRERAIAAGLDPTKDKFTKENQTLVQRVFLSSTFGGEQKLVEQVRKKDWKGLSYELGRNIGWPSLPGGSQSQPGYTPEMFGQKVEKSLQRYVSGTGGPTPNLKPAPGQGGPDLPDFMLSPQKREELRLSATKVAQPPPSQQQGQVNFMPIDLSGGQQQQQSSGGNGAVSSPPAPQKVGPTVPMLPSNNPDNFLVLYSRMVYNVVDG